MKEMKIYAFADEASPMIDMQIAAMKRNGLNGIEIRNVDGENVSKISLEKAKEVRKKLSDSGLVCWSVGSPIGKIDIVNDDWDAHLDVYKHTLDIARELEAGNLRMFSFYMPKDGNPSDYQHQVLDRLHQFVEIAKGSGITLCHENEKGIYGDIAPRCAEILSCVPELKGVFDPANFVQCGQDTLAGWELLHSYIKYMHIKDALADGSVVPAGKGIGNVRQIVAMYRENGGADATIEPHLKVFSGLGSLERKGEESAVGGYCFATNDEAFDAACTAFRALL